MRNEIVSLNQSERKAARWAVIGLGAIVTVIILGYVVGRRHDPNDQAALKPAAAPQYVCRNENGKTCCAAKVAIGPMSTFDITIKLPPGSHTVSTKVKSDGVEYCYTPDATEDDAKDRYPVMNPVRSIFDLNFFGAPGVNGRTHAGVDFESKPNEKVVAGIAGKVSIGKTDKGHTRVAITGDGASGVKEVAYVHLSKIFVSDGDQVEAGKVIAEVAGSKGKKHIPEHLHVEVTNTHGEKINPCSVMECE
jgi:murein DD-endopeptidase MepM/ murein hydrolase activator NlpD